MYTTISHTMIQIIKKVRYFEKKSLSVPSLMVQQLFTILAIVAASIHLSKASSYSTNDSKVIQYDRVRFKEYRDSVPRWGLVVSSNDLAKISKCQMMENVDVVPISDNQIEVIADYETLSALFVWEGGHPSLPIYDSERDLLIQNDTQSLDDEISINIETQTEAEMDAEPDRSLVNKTKPHGRDIESEIIAKLLSAAVIFAPVVIVLIYIYALK